MTELENKTCKPCEGGGAPLNTEAVNTLLKKVKHWTQSKEEKQGNEAKEISRTFSFKNYYETIAFVNAVAWIANQENHHPDLEVAYNRCVVRYTTHAIGGLSENDFICAAKINTLLSNS